MRGCDVLAAFGAQDCITFLQDPRVTSSLEDHRVKYLQVSSLF
jgi:hypothetical protein